MVARVFTVAFQGMDVVSVEVQVQLSMGLPAFTIVGLADKAVGESRERVRSALSAIGLSLPPKRITVNLSPADLQKEGSHYDLPIAMGVLVAMNVLPKDQVHNTTAMGELSLDGSIRTISGVLPAAIHAAAMSHRFVCPSVCGAEAAWASEVEILAPHNLLELINHFKGSQVLTPPTPRQQIQAEHKLDMADIKGQETAKRALEVAAAGGHHMLMVGPPGSGKSMLAARMPSILPPLNPQEALELTMIHSVAGKLDKGALITARPFRDPHHSATLPALIGGGMRVKPGEISLAHHGVLFLDELPEFARDTLEALRQPLETAQINISRANSCVSYPAKIQLITAMNPCKCGFANDVERACSRLPKCVSDYQNKISGPLLDRMDIQIEVPAVPIAKLQQCEKGESSAVVAQRVLRARMVQHERYRLDGVSTNAQMSSSHIDAYAQLTDECAKLMAMAVERLKLSARGYHRILRVARTIADLNVETNIQHHHLTEALGYRGMKNYY